MTESSAPPEPNGPGDPARRTAVGTVRTMAGLGYVTLIGLVLGIIVPRVLKPEGYALFSVSMSLTAWIEAVVLYGLVGGLDKLLVDRGEKWRDLARSAMAMGLIVTAGTGLATALAAPLIAAALGDAKLIPFIRLISVEPLLYVAWNASMAAANARRNYERRVAILAIHWTFRVIATVGLLLLGFEVNGALLGVIIGSAVAAAVGISLGGTGLPRYLVSVRELATFNWPFLVSRLSIALVQMGDIWFVKALLPEAGAAGVFGVASLVSGRLIPLLSSVNAPMLPKLTQSLREGNEESVRELVSGAYRFTLVVSVPALAIFAPNARELLTLVFSADYADADIPATIKLCVLIVTLLAANIEHQLVAAHRPSALMWCRLPALLLMAPTQLWAVPRYGLAGSAAATAAVFTVTAVLMAVPAWKIFRTGPPLMTVVRCAAAGALVWLAGWAWETSGALLLVECVGLLAGYAGILLASRELTSRDLEPVWRGLSLRRKRSGSASDAD